MEVAWVDRIRRREVSRALRGMGLSPQDEAAVERLSRSLVDRILRGSMAVAAPSVGPGTYEAGRGTCAC